MSRETFLARVRQAAHAGLPYRVPLRPFPAAAGYIGVQDDLSERLATEVNAVGGKATIVAGVEEARAALNRILAEGWWDAVVGGDEPASIPAGSRQAFRRCLLWQHELLVRLGIDEMLAARGIARHDYVSLASLPRAQQRETAMACDLGITSCDWAIAETGTLVMCSRTGRERMTSLLPPVHVAIVERRQILPDLFDAVQRLARRGDDWLPSNVTLITGPSKTGDIELQLTTGVHGPSMWHVIVVNDQ
jgi:L-lactate utilization protein LutC